MKLGAFGGSFNPVHFGHLLSAQQLIEFGFVDEVWLIPCYAHIWNKKLAPLKHRWAMLKLCQTLKIKISDIEVKEKRPMPTIETLELLKKHFPQHQFFWVIGEKTLAELPRWIAYQRLISENHFLVLPQANSSSPLSTPSSNFHRVFHKDWIVSNLSSTIVRKRCQKGLSLKGLVPQAVADYIQKHRLYQQSYPL